MPACTSYCDFGESLSSTVTKSHGLPRCIMGTVPPIILFVMSLVLALLYFLKRSWHSHIHPRSPLVYEDLESAINREKCDCALKCTRFDGKCLLESNSMECINNPAEFVHGDNQSSFLYTFQQFLHICLAVLPVIDLITKASVQLDRLQGYVVFNDCTTVVTWLIVLLALRVESRLFFAARVSRHSVMMFLFWTLAFLNENLAFISWNNDHWWFLRKNKNQISEFGLFITRYVFTAFLFLLGLYGPGLYKPAEDVFVVDEEISTEGQVTRQRTNESAFKGIWRKTKMLWPFLWPSERLLQLRVIICFLLLGIGRALNVLVPYTYKLIVDYLTPGQEKVIKEPWKLVVIYVSLRFLQGGGTAGIGVISNLRAFLWIKVQQFTSRTLQVKLFAHLHSLSLRWHLARRTGEVIRMVDRGSNSIYQLLSYMLFNIFPMIADIIVAIVYFSLYFNGWFGLIVFITMVLYISFTIIITEWRTKFRREMNEKDNAAKAKAVDSLLNFETVKYYGGEDYEVGRLNEAILNYQASEWQTIASLNVLNQSQNIVITLGLLAGTLYCASLVANGTLVVGDFVMFITYIVQLYVPLNYFGTYYRMIQQAFIDMENMFDLFQQKREVRDIPDAPPLQVSNGLVEFRDVSFSYRPERQILKNITFRVYPGQTLALVGQTGSGKSTVIRLLYRFYDVDAGSIFIDGQDISRVTQKSLRHSIGVVPQDTVLFNDDIGFNIRYGRMNANDQEVERAAAAADIHNRITTFPDGYKTLVGERGLKLSGGEKQRVAIARTVLKNPPLVLLDEATSALDTQTERNIQASLNSVTINRTTIVVAHRLSTIVNADQILVLHEGEIIERGTHDDLIAAEGTYANMWNQQLKGMEKDTENASNTETEPEEGGGKEKTS